MILYSHVSRLLTDLGEIWYRISARNVVHQLCVSWQHVRWKPYFTKGREWNFPHPYPYFLHLFCPIRINVGTGNVEKIVLSGYEVHEKWSMESRTFLVVKVVPVYAMTASRRVESWLHSFLTSGLDRGEWTGGNVGPRAGLNILEQRKMCATIGIRTPESPTLALGRKWS